MNRIQEIFSGARDTLNDQQKHRWADGTLLRNLRKGMQDIATKTHLFKNSVAIPLESGRYIYELPKNLLEVSHCTYDWEPLPMRSSGWMDKNRECDWRYTTTTQGPQLVVYDEIKRQQLRLYPRPFGQYNTEQAELLGPYGVTTGIADFDIDTPYGVASTILDPDVHAESASSIYGVVSGMVVAQAFVVYYTECPPLPYSIDEAPMLDECFDMALEHYVVARALRNDVDVQNRNMANEEFVLYQRALDAIAELAETDSVSSPNFESHYNPMG